MQLTHENVKATVLAEHGAFVSQLSIDNTEILVADPQARPTPGIPLRSGIPLLFPNAGTLDASQQNQHSTQLAAHGFARFAAWDTVASCGHALTLSLRSDSERLAIYPYQFRCEYRISLIERGIRLALEVVNQDSKTLPLAPGWHPYFNCVAQHKSATLVHEGEPPKLVKLSAQFTNEREFDFGIQMGQQNNFSLTIPGLPTVKMATSNNLKHLQCWSLPEANFVCIEPWTGPPGAMFNGPSYCIPPGKAETFWFQLTV